MISKLLTLLSTAKGAAAAGAIVAAAATTGVAATNQDVQNAVTTTVQNITQANASPSAQPAVVASRNLADQKLRSAFQDDQQKLEKLHSTKVTSADRAKLDDMVSSADAKLRARLTKALDDVAALTLGREGRESPKPTGSPDVKASFTTDAQKKVDDTVTTAITDMDKIVSDTATAISTLATVDPGKPADAGQPADAGKPADVTGGKPATLPTPPARPTP